jgi:hypothetical protein
MRKLIQSVKHVLEIEFLMTQAHFSTRPERRHFSCAASGNQ